MPCESVFPALLTLPVPWTLEEHRMYMYHPQKDPLHRLPGSPSLPLHYQKEAFLPLPSHKSLQNTDIPHISAHLHLPDIPLHVRLPNVNFPEP